MADVVRYLRDSGSLVERDGAWVLARAEADAFRELPASIRSMIARKIERLDEVDRKLLVAASVQGHEFDSAVVAEAIEMDPAEVEERLDALERARVRQAHQEHEFPDLTLSLQYQFVHVLYQNALYGTLQPTRRAWLSGRVARALVMHHQGEHAAIAAGSPRSSNRRAISARARVAPRRRAARRRAVRVSRSAVARRARALGAARDAGRPRAAAARAGAPDDPRAGAPDDEGVGEPGDRARLRPRPRCATSSATRRNCSPSSGRSRCSTRSRRSAAVPQPRRR